MFLKEITEYLDATIFLSELQNPSDNHSVSSIFWNFKVSNIKFL